MSKLINVPYIDQTVKWPTGCESVSTVMLLNYLGLDITVDEFINEYVPMVPFRQEGTTIYGANPNEAFVGSPYDPDSFGCYAPVIKNVLNTVFKDKGMPYEAVLGTGSDTDELLEYIDNDMPVVYWASIELKPTIVGPGWKLEDGSDFTWISNEHCMLLVGYDKDKLVFNDPWLNHGTISYDRELVETRHAEQYGMAVVIKCMN